MQNIIKAVFTLIVILIAVHEAAAQLQPQMPQALKNIMRLEGQWKGTATLTMEGKAHQFTYYADFKKTADGNGLYMEEWFTDPELGSLKGSNLIGYNTNDGKIHWFSVDNMGTTHEHLGTWKSANHFFMQANETQEKKKFMEKIDFVFPDNDAMQFTLVATLGGKEIERGECTFHRTK